jgi:hypothetical protein
VSEPEPQRIRVRVEDPTPQPDPARTGCLWVGGILGVIAGVIVTFLAVPSILNFLFPSETIEVGEAFQDDKLSIMVGNVYFKPNGLGYIVDLSVEAKSTWRPEPRNFVLVLTSGEEIDATSVSIPGDDSQRSPIPQGHSVVELGFPLDARAQASAPDSLHLEEPPVKFELPPVAP